MKAIVFEAEGTLLRSPREDHANDTESLVIHGAAELLPILHRLGIKIAVLASSKIVEHLEHPALREYLHVIVISDARSIDPKKRGLTRALSELDAHPQHTVMVSNRVLDIMTAKEGRMGRTVGVSYGDGNPRALEAAGADCIISDIPSLLDVIE
jgi:phosphoglycolate phosphatase